MSLGIELDGNDGSSDGGCESKGGKARQLEALHSRRQDTPGLPLAQK